MKRNVDIASLFKKHEAKKLAAAASFPPAPATKVLEEGDQEHKSGIEEIVESSLVQSSVVSEAIEVEDVLPPQPPPPTPPVYDSSCLPHDPGERLPISIHVVLVTLGDDPSHKADWTKIHFMVGAFESFEFVAAAHLMYLILGYTNELSECLQRREQDILNAISLVNVAKNRMQQMRSNGWDQFLERVTLFCNKHGVQVPAMEDNYVPYGKSARYARNQINDDHFRREIYIGVIDQISQELDYRFDEINMELLSCMSAFNPSNSFASFDAQKVRRLAEFYPNDLKVHDLLKLELQLDNYIDDVRQDDSFKGIENLVDLSVKLVQPNRHTLYDMVYLLLKLVLLLPVATASVERVSSAMALVKTKKRNKLGDGLLDDCLQTFIERDIFFEVDEDDIIESFMSSRNRRPDKK